MNHTFRSLLSLALAAIGVAAASLLHAAGDENWDNRFGITAPTTPGWIGYPVAAIAVEGTNTYVGGSFTNLTAGSAGTLGSFPANYIARWDGRQWHTLGSGLDSSVLAIAVKDGIVYAGGVFTNAGGVTANGIARWDGTNWSALGSGVAFNDPNQPSGVRTVSALAFVGNDLYAAGTFTSAGGVTAYHIARWDGSAWNPIVHVFNWSFGPGLPSGAYTNNGLGFTSEHTVQAHGSGYALTVVNGKLYVGGQFSTIYDVLVNASAWEETPLTAANLAVLNGDIFAPVGGALTNAPNPYNCFVGALATDGTHLFAGGLFTAVNGVQATNVAQWDGARWSALGTGFYGSGRLGGVQALAVAGGQLYADCTAGVAQWDGAQWTANGPSSIGALAADTQGGLLAGGNFNAINGAIINDIARYANGQWTGLGLGANYPYAEALATDGVNVYISGRFKSAGGIAGTNIIWWDGSTYRSIGGLASDPQALALCNGSLYAAGYAFVSRWDGTNWNAVGSAAPNGQVNGLLAVGTNLYAGGSFTSIGGITAHAIARWDGSAWRNVGSPTTFYYQTINALADYNNQLVVGGNFGWNTPGQSIAQWNGTSWSGLGSGLSSGSGYMVNALATHGTNLIAGGNFVTAGGQAATNLARWNGSAWSSIGNVASGGFNNVMCLASLNGSLYAAGGFTNISGVAANHIAQWNGSAWSALGSGVGVDGQYPQALVPVGNDLFVAGYFTSAGQNPSSGIAVWHGASLSVSAPKLGLSALVGNQVLLSWPASAANFSLETSSSLAPGAIWTPVSGPFPTEGANLLWTNPVTGQAAFFRLHGH